MLQLITIQSVNDYVSFFERLRKIIPQDQALLNLINQLKNIENGCKCQRRARYRSAQNNTSFYISNIKPDQLDELKKEYATENFKFDALIMY